MRAASMHLVGVVDVERAPEGEEPICRDLGARDLELPSEDVLELVERDETWGRGAIVRDHGELKDEEASASVTKPEPSSSKAAKM